MLQTASPMIIHSKEIYWPMKGTPSDVETFHVRVPKAWEWITNQNKIRGSTTEINMSNIQSLVLMRWFNFVVEEFILEIRINLKSQLRKSTMPKITNSRMEMILPRKACIVYRD